MGVRERKEREREERRRNILVSARHAFERFGLENTSMERIAEEAELAKGTLYLYYRTRDELLMGVIVQDLEQIVTSIERIAAGSLAPDKKLLKAVTAFQGFSDGHQLFYKVLTHFDVGRLLGCREDEATQAALDFRELNERMMEAIASVVQEGVDLGMFKLEQSVRQTVFQLIVALKGTMIVAQGGFHPPQWGTYSPAQVLRNTATLLVKGLKA
jgi:AcrR family transcriptional regulator